MERVQKNYINYPRFPIDLLKELIEKRDISQDEYEKVADAIKEYPDLLNFFLY